MRKRDAGMCGSVVVALFATACSTPNGTAPTTTIPTPTSALTTPSAIPTSVIGSAAPEAKNWFDLQVGDCVAKVPQVDLGEVSVPVVACTVAHQAEVYLRAPVEVDAAIADVADNKCDAGIVEYTGRP